jgi:serine protease AprX
MASLAPISINGNTLDPAAPAVRAAGLGTGDAADSNYILIQTKGAVTKDNKDELQRMKVGIKELVSDSTYLCRYEPSDLEPIRKLDFVKWANVYPTHFVVSSRLKPDRATVTPSIMTVLSTHPHMVDVIFHAEHKKDAKTLIEEVAKAAHVNPSGLSGRKDKVRLVVQERYLEGVAKIDEVQSILEVRPNKLFNNIARNILMGKGNVAELNDIVIGSITFRGQNQIVAVADTGLDSNHPAFSGRILAAHALGRPGLTDDTEGHGTHVCGSVLGNSTNAKGVTIQGTAPEAKLVIQSIGDTQGGLGGIPDHLDTLFGEAYNDGARVHSDSWGDSVPAQPYEQLASEIDKFVYENPDMVICFAAGNDGVDDDRNGVTDLRQIGSQAAAKNCITVGASENFRPDLTLEYGFRGFVTQSGHLKFGANPIKFDPMADNSEGMAAFSSRGPSPEGRIKPDIVAPGTGILSARSSEASDAGLFGVSDDPAWMYDAGTSMATPLVSGCAAVVRQALLQNPPQGTGGGGEYSPSAALVKAVLINGAVELKGQYHPSEAGPPPNYNSGWGRVNLTESVSTAMASNSAGCREGAPLQDAGSFEFQVPVTQARATLKATLVWTDPPAPMLQNDLDLTVKVGAQSRVGNTSPNRKNNVEQVVWPNIPQGTAKVRISARSLTKSPQGYAVAWKLSS